MTSASAWPRPRSSKVEAEFRQAAIDVAVGNAKIDLPDALVEARAKELWDQMAHSLSHQGIDRATYLKIAGQGRGRGDRRERPQAGRRAAGLRREAVLAAIVEAEGIEATDDDVLESLERAAAAEGGSPKKLLERLRSSGRLESLKADLAQRKAIEQIAESAKPVKPAEPSTAERAAASGLWTPGS